MRDADDPLAAKVEGQDSPENVPAVPAIPTRVHALAGPAYKIK